MARPPGAEADPDSLPGSEEMVPTRVEDFLAEAAQLAHENTRKKHTKSHAARAILMSPNHTFRSIVAWSGNLDRLFVYICYAELEFPKSSNTDFIHVLDHYILMTSPSFVWYFSGCPEKSFRGSFWIRKLMSFAFSKPIFRVAAIYYLIASLLKGYVQVVPGDISSPIMSKVWI